MKIINFESAFTPVWKIGIDDKMMFLLCIVKFFTI